MFTPMEIEMQKQYPGSWTEAQVTYFEHKPGMKTYVLQIDGYILVDNENLEKIIKSNKILCKLIEDGKLVECSEEECKKLTPFTDSEREQEKIKELENIPAEDKIQLLLNWLQKSSALEIYYYKLKSGEMNQEEISSLYKKYILINRIYSTLPSKKPKNDQPAFVSDGKEKEIDVLTSF